MTSKVKCQGREVTWAVWQVLAHDARMKSPQNTKIGTKVAHPKCNKALYIQGQKVKDQGHQAD